MICNFVLVGIGFVFYIEFGCLWMILVCFIVGSVEIYLVCIKMLVKEYDVCCLIIDLVFIWYKFSNDLIV